MKKIILFIAAGLTLSSSLCFANSSITGHCPNTGNIQAIKDSANPNQYDYAAFFPAGLGMYISYHTESTPVPAASFKSASLNQIQGTNRFVPAACRYTLANGHNITFISAGALSFFEKFSPYSGDWHNGSGIAKTCEGNVASACQWKITYNPPS